MVSQESNLTWPIAVFSLFRALKENLPAITTGIYNWEMRHSMSEMDIKKGQQKNMWQNRQWFAIRQGGILFYFQFIAVSNMTRQVFLRVLYYFEMVDKMLQGVIDSLDVVGCNYLLQV